MYEPSRDLPHGLHLQKRVKIADSSSNSEDIGTARATEFKARLEEFEEDLVDLRSVLLIQLSLSRGLSKLRSRHSQGNIPREIPLGDAYHMKSSIVYQLFYLRFYLRSQEIFKKSRW